jgi:hypothetical protein
MRVVCVQKLRRVSEMDDRQGLGGPVTPRLSPKKNELLRTRQNTPLLSTLNFFINA